uniref:Si:dkey-31g6.6 n=1 Tax=Scophthalmus maximus TaxID=52904 RepID=A0A8D3C4H1_SCOMX
MNGHFVTFHQIPCFPKQARGREPLPVCVCSNSYLSLPPADANPIIKESFAKQLLRSKRQKPGYPDEPMREHLLHMQALDQRAKETNMENLLNPHCPPRCDRNYGHPV